MFSSHKYYTNNKLVWAKHKRDARYGGDGLNYFQQIRSVALSGAKYFSSSFSTFKFIFGAHRFNL